jgi:hypothetical protein
MGIEEVRGSLEDMSRELEHKIKSALEGSGDSTLEVDTS